ncbi:hypothetical protein ACIGNX_32945 [Actinosynnema sp. NPDC053489]|uniref:hypothetical protein n=1 Tax=Actinosynnema sp. NPDC053489 TaxID=3363916 RepID=UPI0037CAE888
MRSATGTSRVRLLLAVLLALGVPIGVASSGPASTGPASTGPADRAPVAVSGWSLSPEPSMHDDRHDWLRLTVTARHVPASPYPDTWWIACQPAPGLSVPGGRPGPDVAGTGSAATAVPTARSCRAPPATANRP